MGQMKVILEARACIRLWSSSTQSPSSLLRMVCVSKLWRFLISTSGIQRSLRIAKLRAVSGCISSPEIRGSNKVIPHWTWTGNSPNYWLSSLTTLSLINEMFRPSVWIFYSIPKLHQKTCQANLMSLIFLYYLFGIFLYYCWALKFTWIIHKREELSLNLRVNSS